MTSQMKMNMPSKRSCTHSLVSIECILNERSLGNWYRKKPQTFFDQMPEPAPHLNDWLLINKQTLMNCSIDVMYVQLATRELRK
jgi:hypothetical protein